MSSQVMLWTILTFLRKGLAYLSSSNKTLAKTANDLKE